MRFHFIAAFIFVQFSLKSQTIKLNLDNIDVSIGQSASDMFSGQFSTLDSISNFAKFIPTSARIVYTGSLEFIMRRRVSEKRFLTLGLILKQYEYRAVSCILPTCRPFDTSWTFAYTTLQMSHQYRFASTHFVNIFIENGLQIDIALVSKSNNLRPFSFSAMSKLSCYFPINEVNQIVFSPSLSLPISRYNNRENGQAFLPYSYGATIGYSRNFVLKNKE
jgi:hypothetical protein